MWRRHPPRPSEHQALEVSAFPRSPSPLPPIPLPVIESELGDEPIVREGGSSTGGEGRENGLMVPVSLDLEQPTSVPCSPRDEVGGVLGLDVDRSLTADVNAGSESYLHTDIVTVDGLNGLELTLLAPPAVYVTLPPDEIATGGCLGTDFDDLAAARDHECPHIPPASADPSSSWIDSHLLPRPERTMSLPNPMTMTGTSTADNGGHDGGLHRNASVMSLSNHAIERMSLSLDRTHAGDIKRIPSTRSTVSTTTATRMVRHHSEMGAMYEMDVESPLGSGMTMGMGMIDDDCIPVLLPTSPLKAFPTSAPWSPLSHDDHPPRPLAMRRDPGYPGLTGTDTLGGTDAQGSTTTTATLQRSSSLDTTTVVTRSKRGATRYGSSINEHRSESSNQGVHHNTLHHGHTSRRPTSSGAELDHQTWHGSTLPLFYNRPWPRIRGSSSHDRRHSTSGPSPDYAHARFLLNDNTRTASASHTRALGALDSPSPQTRASPSPSSSPPPSSSLSTSAPHASTQIPSQDHPHSPFTQTRAITHSLIDQSPTLGAVPGETLVPHSIVPLTPDSIEDSPILVTPSSNAERPLKSPTLQHTAGETDRSSHRLSRPSSSIQRRRSLLHSIRDSISSLPPCLPPLDPLPLTPLSPPDSVERKGLGLEEFDESSEREAIRTTSTPRNRTFENADDEQQHEVAHAVVDPSYSDSSEYSDTIPTETKPPMSLEDPQRVQTHDVNHQFSHHKSNPSVPFSTRTLSTYSTQDHTLGLGLHSPSTSGISSPQTPFSIPSAVSSHRQSKFTFSGSSSASSTYSASDTSSIVGKYSTFSGGASGYHWGFGEKPDISTVFEEEGDYEGLDEEDQRDVEVDFSAHPKPLQQHHATSTGQSSPELAYLEGVRGGGDQRSLGAPISFPKEQQQDLGRDNATQGYRRGNGFGLDSRTPVSALAHFGSLPPNPLQFPSQQSLYGHKYTHRPNPSEYSNNTFIPRRTERSGTVSSRTSGHSSKSQKSVHPFASAINRPTSPPPVPRPKTPAQQANPTNRSRSHPDLLGAISMQQQVHLVPAPAHQVTLASADDKEDEETCPVCCESLSFTFRLPGEKPHVVPECGHALHEECFSTVYGDVPKGDTRRNLGVCGVCRQPMRISEGGGPRKRGKDKMAKLMGQTTSEPSRSQSNTFYPGQDTASVSGRSTQSPQVEADPNADDPLSDSLGMYSQSTRSLGSDGQTKVVIPSITIKAEHSSISRVHRKGKQAITAVITVHVPTAGDRGRYPARSRPAEFGTLRSGQTENLAQLPPSPRSASSHPTEVSSVPPSARSMPPLNGPDPFAHVLVDLQTRLANYATSGLNSLGHLRLFDLLSVRKGALVREFHVYLFQDAIICIVEERKSTMRKIFSSGSSVRSSHSDHSTSTEKGILKMKGRIYMKHVSRILDSSIPGELSLTIEMQDPTMESFILVFRDRGSHETWKRSLNLILEEIVMGTPIQPHQEESNAKLSKLMGAPMPRSASSNKGFASPISQPSPGSMGGINFDLTPQTSTTSYGVTPSSSGFGAHSPVPQSAGGQGELCFNAPLAPIHTPIDLVLILSLPAPSQGASMPLKPRLMRQALQFVLDLMGPKDRISLVACEMGPNGSVRRTPLLNTTRFDSRRRLEAFVELLGTGHRDNDEYEIPVGRDEKQDVVTAVNVALDVILQRKVKNPLSGMLLISDTSESIKRAQMELVTARLDAANIPVHALGYGKGHDPSPLWMISNHTNGSYTFVREWYSLRETIAGAVGGMMSIALTNFKLHINCQDNEFKVIKVSGASQAIVSTGGRTADVELRELRHGETRELMVEMDFIDSAEDRENRYSGETSDESAGMGGGRLGPNSGLNRSAQTSLHKTTSIGTLGLDNLSVADANHMMYEDTLIDEIPVTEVDCSFHDPAAGRSVSRLAHPILLTTAILPSSAAPSSTPPDPMVVRRRMELLASDMITRALLIASRKNYAQAIKILKETRNVVEKIAQGLNAGAGVGTRSRRDVQNLQAFHGLSAVGNDLDVLVDALEEHQEMFDRDARNFAAQQAVVLRTQKSWTKRTPSEGMYCTPEIGQFIQLSGEWQGER